MQTLADILQVHAERIPDRVAFRAPRENGYREWTYHDVWAAAATAAHGLRLRGLQPDDRVALYGENSPEWVLAYLAIHLAGGAVIPLDAQYGTRELNNLLRFAGATRMWCATTVRNQAEEGCRNTPVREILCIEDTPDLFPPDATPPELPPRTPGSLMALIFTSGTTGQPKGVRLTDSNILSNVLTLRTLDIILPDDNLLCLLPLHHAYAMNATILVPLATGASMTFCPSLHGPDILQAVRDTAVTVLPAVPKLLEGFHRAIFTRIQQAPPSRRTTFRLLRSLSRGLRKTTGWNPGRFLFPPIHHPFGPAFRFFACGGAKLDAAIAHDFLDLGLPVVEGYGLTETSPVVTFNIPGKPRPGRVGKPLPDVEIRIHNPGEDGTGEILVRGPNVMDGYDQRPDETAKVIRDGWFHTGDLGFLDRDGFLAITGRAKEVIVMASGKNVYPDEVEHHYEQCPLVKELCVVPDTAPDGRVNRLAALVVPDLDELRRRKIVSIRASILQAFTEIGQRLPSYMRLNRVNIVTGEFPRTRLGKLRRAEIQATAFQPMEESTPTLTDEDQTLMDAPGAQALIERIQSLSGSSAALRPSSHLELDAGLDSLARVELDSILEREFGVRIPPDEIPHISTVGDLLQRLSGEHAGAGTVQWRDILSERVLPPLESLFNLHRGPLARAGVATLRTTLRAVLRLGFRLDVQGLEHLPANGPYLLCPTHASRIDAALIYLTLSSQHIETLTFLGAEQYFQTPLMRFIGRLTRVIPTASADTIRSSLQRAAEAIAMGRSVCLFPEGHISRDGFLLPPRTGAGILACELHVPVVPVLIRGSFQTLSFAHPRLRIVPLGLTFAPPIPPPPSPSPKDYTTITQSWLHSIILLRLQDDQSLSPTAGLSPRIPDSMLPAA
jgi:long-chain acyl-CoA synthetase